MAERILGVGNDSGKILEHEKKSQDLKDFNVVSEYEWVTCNKFCKTNAQLCSTLSCLLGMLGEPSKIVNIKAF